MNKNRFRICQGEREGETGEKLLVQAKQNMFPVADGSPAGDKQATLDALADSDERTSNNQQRKTRNYMAMYEMTIGKYNNTLKN